MDITPQLKSYIEDQMRARKWRAADLSRASGVSETGVGRILNGKVHSLTPATVKAFCNVFRLTDIELYSIAKGGAANAPEKTLDEEAKLAAWIRTQPAHVREAFLTLAKRYGFKE